MERAVWDSPEMLSCACSKAGPRSALLLHQVWGIELLRFVQPCLFVTHILAVGMTMRTAPCPKEPHGGWHGRPLSSTPSRHTAKERNGSATTLLFIARLSKTPLEAHTQERAANKSVCVLFPPAVPLGVVRVNPDEPQHSYNTAVRPTPASLGNDS